MLVGWITPTYEEIPCPYTWHVNFLKENKDKYLKEIFPDLQERLQTCDKFYDDWIEDAPEAPDNLYDQWETLHEQIEEDLLNAVYKAGWIRVGTWADTMTFECSQDTILSKGSWMKEYAEMEGYKAIFHPRKIH